MEMKEKKDCKIVQDLLPNYIEKLTNKETNQYIEEHLEECEECKKILETMKKDIALDSKKVNKEEVNYFKKYRNKMRILKAIILVIVILFLIIIGRRMFIMITLLEKAKVSKEASNYYIRVSRYQGDSVAFDEVYKKDDKKVTISYFYDYKINNSSKWIEYQDENKRNAYYETADGEKIAVLNIEQEVIPTLMSEAYGYVEIENVWLLIQNALISSVQTINCNGKECYYFSNFRFGVNMIGSEVGYRTLYR